MPEHDSVAPRPKPSRICAIDQMRALAIGGMILSHFAPGVLERVSLARWIEETVLIVGRFATPAFVVVFGLTAGLVYAPRFYSGEERDVVRRLVRRGVLLLGCSVLIAVPDYVVLVWQGAPAMQWCYATYSVLSFYCLAVTTLPGWLWLSRSAPLVLLPTFGAMLWTIALWLGFGGWPPEESRAIEFVRMNLVSGGFAYFGMMGTALLCTPIGLLLRAARRRGSIGRLIATIAVAGAAITVAGLLLYARSDTTVEMIVDGDAKSPPRLWYFMTFGGAALLLFSALAAAEQGLPSARTVLYPLTLAGQAALTIYLGHAFVLPLLALADWLGMPLTGLMRAAIPAIVFGAYCGAILWVQHRRSRATVRTRGLSVSIGS